MPGAVPDREVDGPVVLGQLEALKGEPVRVDAAACCRSERRCETRRVEQRLTGVPRRIDDEERAPVRHRGPIPEPSVREPGRPAREPTHERRRVRRERAFGSGVIIRGDLTGLLGCEWRGTENEQ